MNAAFTWIALLLNTEIKLCKNILKTLGQFFLQDLNIVKFFHSCKLKPWYFKLHDVVNLFAVCKSVKNSFFFFAYKLVAVQRLLELWITICFIVHIYSLFVLEKQTSKKADHASLISLSDVLPSGKFSFFLKRQIESTRKPFVLYI